MDEHDINSIIKELNEKAKNFKWHENRIEKYGIIAKKIKNKAKLNGNYTLLDLDDFEKSI